LSSAERAGPALLPVMNLTHALFKTSIGKKLIMAVTGLVLIGFVIGHLAGNLQIFLEPAKMNAYGHFLHEGLGSWLWVIRFFLLIATVLHIWAAVALTLENRRARPQDYAVKYTIQASFASRTMRWSGFIVLAFIAYHLAHFTFQILHPEYRDLKFVMPDGVAVHDVHAMVVLGFSNLWISLFYIVAVGLLSIHLSHGASSMFQTVGLRNSNWAVFLRRFSVGLAVIYFLLNAAIPLAVLGKVGQTNRPDISRSLAPAAQLAPGR
jgi:succinate dehydrogenase / fumarate reductase, cytochrome b subunit